VPDEIETHLQIMREKSSQSSVHSPAFKF